MKTLLTLFMASTAYAADGVAKSEPRTPAEEKKAFTLPPGFEVQLVASEPEIQKPMQLAFDSKGRIWVTTSHLYPFAAPKGQGTDKLYVLSDFDANGKAGKVSVFDDKLNIPIGILPMKGGAEVIVGEVGRILKLTDTDGDGKADKREVLFDGFGTQDTHGMTNSYLSTPDGWIYACHGYLNDSRVKGKDGHEVHMQSGHTFRFKPDGSRIEIFTKGQVNPFGLCTDPWGNFYTADCHSRPMTQLIRGATYDSFGKPHDGLGYAPHVINHMHGSTGLCGIAFYSADYFPKDWQDVMFVGNCVTSRINCDRIEWRGSTPVGKELPDFLVSSDPWFRPVDLKIGPDGAMYVNDFYNRIIGHYEVDLRHPGRDKDRGRIWRIVRTDKAPVTLKEVPMELEIVAMQTATMFTKLNDEIRNVILITFTDTQSVRVKRAAIDVMTAHPHEFFVEPLFEFLPKIAADDTHMRMAARIALRDCIIAAGGVGKVKAMATGAKAVALYDVAVAIRSKESSAFLAENIGLAGLDATHRVAAAKVIGQFDPELSMTVMKAIGSSHEVVNSLLTGLQAGGARKLPAGLASVIDSMMLTEMTNAKPDFGIVAANLKLALSFPDSHAEFEAMEAVKTVLKWLTISPIPVNSKAALAEAIAPLPMMKEPLTKILQDSNAPLFLRSRLAVSLLAKPTAEELTMSRALLKTSPYALAISIATGLAGNANGAQTLFDAVAAGEAPARLLQERAVLNRLRNAKVPDLEKKVSALTKNLPSAEKRIDDLIKARADGYRNAKSDSEKGKAVYAKNCAICHQLNGEGTKIGPQLDGVGIRGLERIIEDTIDPNRNIDINFKATKLDLRDGRSITGLLVREEPAAYAIVDVLGKEQLIPKADVDEKTKLAQSAMPGNFDTSLAEADYYHLVAYLLEQKPKK